MVANLLSRINYQKISTALTIVNTGWSLYSQTRDRIHNMRESRRYTLSVSENDRLYFEIHRWLLDNVSESEAKSLFAKTSKEEIRFYYDAEDVQTIMIEGYPVMVFLDNGSISEDSNTDDGAKVALDQNQKIFAPNELVFKADSPQAIAAVKRLLKKLAEEVYRQPSMLYVGNTWGGWNIRGRADKRPLDAVILKQGQKETLVTDMDEFQAQRELYFELGIPWHRGYVFTGPPGTGKTSIAQALASRVNGNVYFLSLNSVEGDSALASQISDIRIEEGSVGVLVLEDVDTVKAAKSRDVEEGVTLEGLLNVLDGFLTPDGLITIMTTNHLHLLDDALIRPGRADVIMEIGYLDDDQFYRLVESFIGHRDASLLTLPSVQDVNVTPAEVVGVFKGHLKNPLDSINEIRNLVLDKRRATLVI